MELIQRPKDGDRLDASETMYPSSLEVIRGNYEFNDNTSTIFGYIFSGSAHLSSDTIQIKAMAGTFFCFPGKARIKSTGIVVIMRRFGYRGLLTVGLIEKIGRLTYIDGCSTTMVVPPPRFGDPVLNHLHFPAGVRQTEHVHPSIRFGVVVKGRGVAYGSDSSGRKKWKKPLLEGSVFLLNSQDRHAFHTLESPRGMDIICLHPESDWGPTDQSHPMLNRTYINK